MITLSGKTGHRPIPQSAFNRLKNLKAPVVQEFMQAIKNVQRLNSFAEELVQGAIRNNKGTIQASVLTEDEFDYYIMCTMFDRYIQQKDARAISRYDFVAISEVIVKYYFHKLRPSIQEIAVLQQELKHARRTFSRV